MAPQGIEVARLDHLGIVAGVCREIGLAEYLDARDTQTHERVSVGTATVAMILNGVGFANRRLYLVCPFFKTKPVEHWALCGDQGRDARVSTAWGARSIGCTRMIPPSCLLALLDKHARSLA